MKKNLDSMKVKNDLRIKKDSSAQNVIRVLGTIHLVFGFVSIYNHNLFVAYLCMQSGILIHIIAANWETIKDV